MSPLGQSWGVEPAEKDLSFACDRLDGPFDEDFYRGITVHAPAASVFRWLCQLRVAPYSYDWIDNWGRRSPRHLIPGLENLSIGQTVCTIFDLVDFEPDRHLTILIKPNSLGSRAFGDVAITYLVIPLSDDSCRLLAKLRVCYPRGPYGWLCRAALPPGDWVMMRRQLLNLRDLAQAHQVERAGEPPAPPT